MKNKKGASGVGVAMVILMSVLVVGLFGFGYYMVTKDTSGGTAQTIISQPAVEQISQASSSGDVAQIKVFVRNLAANNINDKLAVATYCQDDKGSFIIDGTTSSTSAEITGSTTRGRTITCWAFDSTHQTKNVVPVTVDEEVEHIVIDAYALPTNGHLQFYSDTYATGTAGIVNVTSVGASSTGTLQKMRYTNNNTNLIFPLGGFYFGTVPSSNVSKIDVSGGLSLSGFASGATAQLVDSTGSLPTAVSTRKDNWDFVFEVDSNPSETGNQALLVEENDYIESSAVKVTGDGEGCTSAGELISSYVFTKGYSRSTKDQSVKYGAETDADSSAVISSDLTGDTFYCIG